MKARDLRSCTASISATTTTATGTCCRRPKSQHWAKVVFQEWFPQVYKDTHQQGSYGARLTIPPKYDPINPHVDPLMWRASQLLGGAMGTKLEAEGVTGVESQVHYDAWFMASFHGVSNLSNMTSFHTESASARWSGRSTSTRSRLCRAPGAVPKTRPR